MISTTLVVLLLIAFNIMDGQTQTLTQLIQEKYPDLNKSETETTHPPKRHHDDISLLNTSDSRYDPKTSYSVSAKVFQLAQKLSKLYLEEHDEKYQVFSPISISGAVHMVLLGASGKTFKDLMRVLDYTEDEVLANMPYKIHEELGLLLEDLVTNFQSPRRQRPTDSWKFTPYAYDETPQEYESADKVNHKITISNGIFVQNGYSLRPDYQTAIETIYRSDVVNLDFQRNPIDSATYINDWVKKNTEDRIKNIIGDNISPETKVIVASALYFKALWNRNFMEGATKKRNFFPDGPDGRAIAVDMMAHGGKFPFFDSVEYDCRIIGLPYKNLLSTMYVIMPNNSTGKKLKELQATLTSEKIEQMIESMEHKWSIIIFPKMHLTSSFNLKDGFRKLGLKSLFNPVESDLSLISSGYETPFDQQQPAPSQLDSNPGSNSVSSFSHNNKFTGGFVREEDDSNDRLIFSRFGEEGTTEAEELTTEEEKLVTEKTVAKEESPVSNEKETTKTKREADPSKCLKDLDFLRNQFILYNSGKNPGLFADDIVHKVDLEINEKGTVGGATTAITLNRSGPQVLFRAEGPFMFLIRHEATRIPIFYGTVFEPFNDK